MSKPYNTAHHADAVGAMCGRFQAQSRVIWALVALQAVSIASLISVVNKKNIEVYEVQPDGDTRFHGTLQNLGAPPSKREAEFVGRRFASLLLDRNSSTVSENMSAAMDMCSEQMRAEAPSRWGIDEAIKQIVSEKVRTKMTWGHAHVSAEDDLFRVRLRGSQAFFPIAQADDVAWGAKSFDVSVLMRQRERDPIIFSSGLEVIDFTIVEDEQQIEARRSHP